MSKFALNSQAYAVQSKIVLISTFITSAFTFRDLLLDCSLLKGFVSTQMAVVDDFGAHSVDGFLFENCCFALRVCQTIDLSLSDDQHCCRGSPSLSFADDVRTKILNLITARFLRTCALHVIA